VYRIGLQIRRQQAPRRPGIGAVITRGPPPASEVHPGRFIPQQLAVSRSGLALRQPVSGLRNSSVTINWRIAAYEASAATVVSHRFVGPRPRVRTAPDPACRVRRGRGSAPPGLPTPATAQWRPPGVEIDIQRAFRNMQLVGDLPHTELTLAIKRLGG
jgi:hypothetical protein